MPETLTPLDAIDRIVYLLDRGLAPSPKVRAFTRAGEIVAAIDAADLDELIATGGLYDLEGIGRSTGRAITQAHQGEIPDYLTNLEETTVIPVGGGARLRTALRGDCHTHSLWSDGGASIEAMARTARDLGHDYMVLTDHSPRLTIAHGLNRDRLLEQLAEIDGLEDRLAPFRILTGMEVDIFEDGSLDLDEDLLERLDIVVGSVHSKFTLDREAMTRRLVVALAGPHIDILGHCTNRKVTGRERPPSVFDPDLVFAAAARFDKAIEINCRPERQDPPEKLLESAVEWNTKIAIDTDAHAPGQLEWLSYGCDKAIRCGVNPDNVINTWSAEDLLSWAANHPAGDL